MLSRVANSIYWSSRYLERAENISRIAYVKLHYGLGNDTQKNEQWFALIKTSGDEKNFHKHYKKVSYENILKFLLSSKDSCNSIYSCIKSGRENARTVRDIISVKMWEQINQLYWSTQEFVKKRSITNNLEDYLCNIQDHYMSYLGAIESTMNHNEAWHFSKLARMIERGDKTGRILDVHYFTINANEGAADQNLSSSLLAKSLLKSASALEMYKQSHIVISPKDVALFLIFDPTFPRSIYYCSHEMANSIKNICAYCNHPKSTEIIDLTASLLDYIETSRNNEFTPEWLHYFIDQFQTRINEIDAKLYELFFATNITPCSLQESPAL